MKAVRLHGAADMRLEEMAHPGEPGPGQVLLRNRAVGICGSDLHTYQDGRIGDTKISAPLVLGHEFGSVVEAVGEGALDALGNPIAPGTHVAVDPAQPCGKCEQCELGHPNLCLHIRFCGHFPEGGALCEYMHMPGSTCFPIDKSMDFGEASLLETLGVALHAIDLAKVRVGHTVAILGGGPIGNCIFQVAKAAGASPIFVTDKFDWRLDIAKKLGAISINCDKVDPVDYVMSATNGRGVDVAIEAAWADHSIQQAGDMARYGGAVVLVGIPGDDRFVLKHSSVRRKGLTIKLARRMKHVYPRAIAMHQRGAVDLKSLISHRVKLEKTAEAFAMNHRYERGVMKVIVEI